MEFFNRLEFENGSIIFGNKRIHDYKGKLAHMSVGVNCVKKLEDSSPLPKKSTTKDPQKSPLCRVTGKPAIV